MENGVITVEQLKKQFGEFEDTTAESRALSEKCRDYRDLKCYTGDQLTELQRRKQAPLVVPKIAEKVDFLVGMELQQRSDPRALPRTQEHEESADAVTDALRYVADNNEFDQTASDVFEQAMLVEGYAGAIIEPKLVMDPVKREERVEIQVNFVPFDRVYFDPASRRRDFKDAMYVGLVAWMDFDEAKQRYPKKADDIGSLQDQCAGTDTFEDKPKWLDKGRRRIKVCQHYFKQEGVWHVAHFTDGLFLMDAKPSPLEDEAGQPECPIELVHGYITRDNERYGLVNSLLGLQDEINHRRSKSLHMLSTKQLHFEQGALSNPRKTADELKKPDGAVEFPAGTLAEGRAQVHSNMELATGQAQLLQDAKQEMDQRGATSLIQDMSSGDLSGSAITRIQKMGTMQMGRLFDAHRNWKKRVYRQVWNRVKQFWDEERWIRVTDDEDKPKWTGLNVPVTVGEALKEQAEQGDQRAQMALQQMVAMQDPRLNQVHTMRNNVAEMDMDIIMAEAPDTLNIQQEQFETMAELAKMYGPEKVPFETMLELSSLYGKDAIKEKLAGDPQQAQMLAQMQQMQQQIQQMAVQLDMAEKQAKIEKTKADTAKTMAETEQTHIENQVAAAFPDTRPNFNI
ncbi:hypothetical protein [Alcanivorax sp.]|uniref:portal protein n=1 Tax=Alcanivorax sp. TaxID=1872427 RepID=UPI003A8DF016